MLWRYTLESRGFRLSRSKTEYMECSFSGRSEINPIEINLGGEKVPKMDHFRYLESVLQNNGGLEKDINHRIQAGWMKWRSASGILCDQNMALPLKENFYKTAYVRLYYMKVNVGKPRNKTSVAEIGSSVD